MQEKVLRRKQSLFAADLLEHAFEIADALDGKSVCVIGGAGSIGSSFIKEMLKHGHPRSLVVIDLNENALAELTRDMRSSNGIDIPADYRPYALSYADPIFARMFREEKGFDIVANFSAHKHVRSEKDKYSVQALLENNDLKAVQLMELLSEYKPEHFFCVSTDKAANPVNVMGASKRIMEDLVMAYSDRFKVTTARFANVAFSNGSLPDSWLKRLNLRQPLSAPVDVKRFFVSMEEAGQICLMACLLGKSGEIFYPKIEESQMLRFHEICDDFLKAQGLEKMECADEYEARLFAEKMSPGSRCYPVVYSRSDTTGEKAYEEFYEAGETLDTKRFASLGVICHEKRRSLKEVRAFFDRMQSLFARDFTKAEVVELIQTFIPNFAHEERNLNLNDKM